MKYHRLRCQIQKLLGKVEIFFFLKEQIKNQDKISDSLLSQLSKRDDVLLQNRWPAIKRKTVSVQTMKVERRAATTMTTSSKSTATTTANQQIQTESKTINENLSETPSGKTNINEKEKEKDTVNQNSPENIKGNENVEKEVRNTQEKKITGKQEQ